MGHVEQPMFMLQRLGKVHFTCELDLKCVKSAVENPLMNRGFSESNTTIQETP
jgi:hypothetical protein